MMAMFLMALTCPCGTSVPVALLLAWLVQELCGGASHQATDRTKKEFLILL